MRIAIVGAGMTGTLAALHLARHAAAPVALTLIDRRARLGPAEAALRREDQPMTVPVADASAFPDDPAHFVRWLWAREIPAIGGAPVPPSGQAFVPRRAWRRYLDEMLEELIRVADGLVTLDSRPRAVSRIDRSRRGLTLHFAEGGAVEADHAVMATGPFRTRLPIADRRIGGAGARRILDPWDAEGFGWIGAQDPVVVLGTGQAMAEAALALDAAGHRGPIHAIGRRALLPCRHAPVSDPLAPFDPESPPAGVAEAAKILRAAARRAGQQDAEGGWRRAVDGARPAADAVWQAWTDRTRNRFLRHALPFWEAHRHRLAPTAADRIDRMIAEGRLTVEAARIPAMAAEESGVRLAVRPRGGGVERVEEAAWLINAAGPEVDFARLDEPLIAQLSTNGLARPDRLRLGLAVTEDLRLVGRTGEPTPGLWALGPPTRGRFFEPVEIPEIRDQASAFAQTLLTQAMAG